MSNAKKYLPLITGIAIAVGVLIGGKLSFRDTSDKLFTTNSKKDKLNRLIDYIDFEYVEEVNTDSIVDVTVNGILNNLDPHSVYIPKKDLKNITENMRGDFIGIGINYYPYKDTIAVIRPTEGGPSQRAGILAGDRIIMADGDSLAGKFFDEKNIASKLKGGKNTKVLLKVYRPQTKETLDIEVKRNAIPIKSVEASYMLTNNLGYIKINRFAESTFSEFKNALERLQQNGATKLALDLRDNPGGFLGIAEQIADEFLSANTLIVFTKNKKGRVVKTFATNRGDFEEGDIYILINESSASASEVIAGALQDNDKGVIVGRRSYGKGLVQREMALGDGSAVRLTVSRYYTPTGRSIQKTYNNGNNRSYFNDYYKRLRTGELTDSVNIEIADSLKFTTPGGKIVYGGGGIIPDVFVPIDTAFDNETINYLRNSGYFSKFTFEDLDRDRGLFQDLSKQDFVENFEVDDAFFGRFQDYLNNSEGTNFRFSAFKDVIKVLIKAELARQLYDDNARQEVVNSNDVMIHDVMELSKVETGFNH